MCVSMWSKKPTPVATSAWPEPSRFRVSLMSVSAVLRAMVAVRGIRGSLQFGQQPVDLRVGADGDAQAVVAVVVHVADQDLPPLQLLVDRLDRPVGSGGTRRSSPGSASPSKPSSVELAGRMPLARGEDLRPQCRQVVLVLERRGRGGQAQHVAVVRVLHLDQFADRGRVARPRSRSGCRPARTTCSASA